MPRPALPVPVQADTVVTNAAEVWALRPVPLRRDAVEALEPFRPGFVALRDGRVVDAGAGEGPVAQAIRVVDAAGGIVVPGLVDGHTHPVFLGDRAAELSWKLEGLSYFEIQRRGGGIMSTVDATRRGTVAGLARAATAHLKPLAALGTTLAETKTGYHLTPDGEIQALEALGRVRGVRVSPTFLGGHLVPPGLERAGFIDSMITATAEAAKRGLARSCDAFVDAGALTPDEGRQLLEAGRGAGLLCRLHADELERTGAARLAIELGARSADHLNRCTPEDVQALAGADICCTLCPGTPLTTPGVAWPPARALYDAGAVVALGTDLNPNAWMADPWLVFRLAVHQMRLPPAAALAGMTCNPAWSLDEPNHGHLGAGAAGGCVILDAPSLVHAAYQFRPLKVRVVPGAPA